MNIDLFKDRKYQEIIKKHASRTDFIINKAFYDYDEISYKAIIDQSPIIEHISFFCYLHQSYFGCMLIDNKYYIIEVDDECMIKIVADNEVGWMEGPLWIYDDHDEQLQQLNLAMNEEFNIPIASNDYNSFQKVMDSHPEWFN